jgi:hypothetical protein
MTKRLYHLLSIVEKKAEPITWDSVCFAVRRVEVDEDGYIKNFQVSPCSYLKGVLSADIAFYKSEILNYGAKEDQYQFYREPGIFNSIYGRGQSGGRSDSGVRPLATIQGIVVVRDNDRLPWKIVVMKRGANVHGAPGKYQLPPAGSCEVFNAQEHREQIAKGFDVIQTLQREFLEEIYGDERMKCNKGGTKPFPVFNTVKSTKNAFDSVYGEAASRWKGSRPLDSVHFLGAIIEPLSLRLALTFLIVIQSEKILGFEEDYDEPPFKGKASFLKGCSSEKDGALQIFDFPEMADQLRDQNHSWHATSVAALKLFSDTLQPENSWLREWFPDMPMLVDNEASASKV